MIMETETDIEQDQEDNDLSQTQSSFSEANTSSSSIIQNNNFNIKDMFINTPNKSRRKCVYCDKIYSLHTATRPFFQITCEVSSESTTIGTAVLFVASMGNFLEETSNSHDNEDIKKAAKLMLTKCEAYEGFFCTLTNYISSFLDPKTKQ
ncbi:unnamed protein product [Gordionus sp. m RMFG-2023]